MRQISQKLYPNAITKDIQEQEYWNLFALKAAVNPVPGRPDLKLCFEAIASVIFNFTYLDMFWKVTHLKPK